MLGMTFASTRITAREAAKTVYYPLPWEFRITKVRNTAYYPCSVRMSSQSS